MNPDDNQQVSSNAAFSGSSLGAPSPAPAFASSSPFPSPAPMTPPAQAEPVNAFGTNDPYQAPDPQTPADASDSADNAQPVTPLNDFLNDENGPSFLDDKPADSPTSAPQIDDTATSTGSPDAASVPSSDQDDLSNMKQQALTQLQPLVDHLDQSAEEQFKTTMMMIQATDDHTMLKKAFEAAQKIEDDKERAQALLDVINEINYFTQVHEADTPA